MTDTLVEKIDALLPQTQCELCEYPGCRPYAQAIATEGEAIDRCLPGGVRVLRQLGALLSQDVVSLEQEMKLKKKSPSVARVREAECIGCTKCITACPVDAIIGTSKQMHVVITDACNGCELCVPPCPVDCIDMRDVTLNDIQQQQLAERSRARFQAKKQRLVSQEQRTAQAHQRAKMSAGQQTVQVRQQAIAAALARVKQKKDSQHESAKT